MAQRTRRILAAALMALVGLTIASCAKPTPTPTPAPFPTAVPSPTPPFHQVIDGSRYVLLYDGVELAGEQIHATKSDDEIVVTSELRYVASPYTVERRTLVINASLSPMRYELERVTSGVRSLWVAERTTRGMSVLNNHQAWPGPIAFDAIRPDADIMVEASPSALPFVLLALRSGYLTEAQPMLELHAIDIIEDLPFSRALTLESAPGRTGAVIGTTAVEATIDDGPNPTLTLWVRPDSGELYGAEVPDMTASPWLGRIQPTLAEPAHLEIKRVAELSPAPGSPPPENTETIILETPDEILTASLRLPSGNGPHPCLISLGAGDITTRLALSDGWLKQGWAVCELYPRGTGLSEGSYQRGDLTARATDAIAIVQSLAERPDIAQDRLVLVGMGNAGLSAVLALGADENLAGAVVGSAACHEPLIPDLATSRLRGPMAESLGWSPDDADAFRTASVDQWQRWLYEDEDEIALLRRRVPLDELRAYADTDIRAEIVASDQPILLLVGETARWPTPETQGDLVTSLNEEGRSGITVAVIPQAGDILWEPPSGPLLPDTESTIQDWLAALDL